MAAAAAFTWATGGPPRASWRRAAAAASSSGSGRYSPTWFRVIAANSASCSRSSPTAAMSSRVPLRSKTTQPIAVTLARLADEGALDRRQPPPPHHPGRARRPGARRGGLGGARLPGRRRLGRPPGPGGRSRRRGLGRRGRPGRAHRRRRAPPGRPRRGGRLPRHARCAAAGGEGLPLRPPPRPRGPRAGDGAVPADPRVPRPAVRGRGDGLGSRGMASTAGRTRLARARVIAVRDGGARERADGLAAEEPLEIRAAGPGQEPVRVAVTMRTPGHDFELAAGFLVTEGLLAPGEIASVAYCEDPDAQRYNVVTVSARAPFDLGGAERNFFASSSCGICGKAALEAVSVRCEPLTDATTAGEATLLALPDAMRAAQHVFDRTGGLHAAGLFGADGELLLLREDVGRHNAVDKVAGALALEGGDGAERILLVSGRLSFEIVQKAAVARVPIVCAVSAPSSLAVEAAEELGLTAVGFLRPGGFNIYAHPERIATTGAP